MSKKLLKESKPSSKNSSDSKVVSPSTMEELLSSYGSVVNSHKKGDVVSGVVASITGKEVLIDFGGKTEGSVGEKEWPQIKDYVSTLKPGDKITGIVISTENNRGQLVVSLRKASNVNKWGRSKELLDSGKSVTVKAVEVNRGGLLVEFEGLRGFLPGSQLSSPYQGDLGKMLNKSFVVKVIEVDQAQNRLVFSERAAGGGAEVAKKLEELKGKVKVGEKYKGKVSAVVNYGIFVNLEAPATGADGLVHISEISWQKVDDLNSLFKVGDEVEVLVLGINENDGKLNLSLKQLQPDPWTSLAGKFEKDQTVSGKVTKVTQYGVFVQIGESIEGLIRISKIPPTMEIKEGDKMSCTIETVDMVSHKISLLPILTEKPVMYK